MSQLLDAVELPWNGRPVRVEIGWIEAARTDAPLIVFLHEGLGSLSAWREFPRRLCKAAGCRGLVYSRPGYGRSTPRAVDETWGPDFMHRQALELLPALLRALDIDAERDPPWLFGHSDGASIALIYAAARPRAVRGLILLAPHIMVEDLSITSIEGARVRYLSSDLRERLARHHDDPDSAFWGWNDIWLHPAFRQWSIEAELDRIECPLLALQGIDDEYGTLEQVRGIARHLPGAEVIELADCGHAPQRDQPDAVIAASTRFFRRQPPGDRR